MRSPSARLCHLRFVSAADEGIVLVPRSSRLLVLIAVLVAIALGLTVTALVLEVSRDDHDGEAGARSNTTSTATAEPTSSPDPAETSTRSVPSTDPPTSTETVTPAAVQNDPVSEAELAELAFILTIRSNVPAFDGIEDQILIDLALSACDLFDTGASLETVLLGALSGAGDNADNPVFLEGVGQTIGAGVAAYCPEHNSKIN